MEVARHGPAIIDQAISEIADVYKRAWAETPFAASRSQVRDFQAMLMNHRVRPEFRIVTARMNSDRLIAFAYGYTSTPGGWWRDMVAAAFSPEEEDRWFGNCFEFVELAVDPLVQKQGIGTMLHDVLLEGVPHRTSVLSTQKTNERAIALYRGRGWRRIMDDFYFPNRAYPYVIFGRILADLRGSRLGHRSRTSPEP